MPAEIYKESSLTACRPSYRKHAIKCRDRRDSYILHFYEELMRRIEAGTDHACIAGNVIKDPEAKLGESKYIAQKHARLSLTDQTPQAS